jgi:hypothetical protein
VTQTFEFVDTDSHKMFWIPALVRTRPVNGSKLTFYFILERKIGIFILLPVFRVAIDMFRVICTREERC